MQFSRDRKAVVRFQPRDSCTSNDESTKQKSILKSGRPRGVIDWDDEQVSVGSCAAVRVARQINHRVFRVHKMRQAWPRNAPLGHFNQAAKANFSNVVIERFRNER